MGKGDFYHIRRRPARAAIVLVRESSCRTLLFDANRQLGIPMSLLLQLIEWVEHREPHVCGELR
jgi:hypothetical protein